MALIGDFFRALAQIGDARFLGVFLKALALTVALLIAATFGAGWIASFIPTDLGVWPLIGQVTLPIAALQGFAVIGVLLASSFLMIPVAAMFVGFFLDEIADAVEAKHYPTLPEPARGTFAGDLFEAARFTMLVIFVNLIALVFYVITGPLGPFVFLAVNGYLLGREYFELVAVRHIPSGEARRLRKKHRWRVWLAGVLMTIPLTIPVMNLIIPVLGVAVVTHQFHRLWGKA